MRRAIEIEILPPENAAGNVTEDSGDEDGGGIINNLPGNKFRSQALLGDPEAEVEDHAPQKKSNVKRITKKMGEKRYY